MRVQTALLAALAMLSACDRGTTRASDASQTQITVSLHIDFSDQPDVIDSLSLPAGSNVADALIASGDSGKFTIQATGSGAAYFVTGLNDERAAPRKGLYWVFCVNGVFATRGAGDLNLNPGDAVIWKRAPYEWDCQPS